MKVNRLYSFLIAVLTITVVACSSDEGIDEVGVNAEDIEIESTAEAVFDDLDNVTDEALSLTSFSNGRVERKNIPDCAIVTKDEAIGQIIIDFGNGCEGRNGVIRKGKVIINYSGERFAPGASRSIAFEDYFIDSLQIEGTRVWTNVSESVDTNPTFFISLSGGKITFADGTSMTREASHTRTFIKSEDGVSVDESTLSGSASGVNLDGLSYSHTIDASTPLLFTSDCRLSGVKTAVYGIVSIAVEGESEKTVDFGNGACDNLAIITQDGTSTEVEINSKRRRRGLFRRIRG